VRSVVQFLSHKLGIEDNERELVAWGAIALALVGWSDVSIQNAAETFFLKRVGVEYLPVAFLASSVLLVVTTSLVGWVIVHRWRPNLLPRVFVSLGISVLPLWLLIYLEVPGAFFLLILTSKQIKAVALLVFWVALGNMLNARQAKRLFAPLIAGLTVGTIAGSFASEPLSRVIEINGLIYFAAFMLGLGALMTIGVERAGATRLERGLEDFRSQRLPARAKDETGGLKERLALIGQLWARSGLFRLLFLTTLCSGILGPMLYFQFSYVADLATRGTGGEQRLLALYSQLRGWMNLAILLIQIVFASKLYRHIGVPLAAALSPVIYLLGFLGLSFQLSLAAGITAVAAARVQDDAIYDPGVRILFNLFPDELKARATALLEGPVKRLGGTLGNIFTLSALAVGSATWVGYLGFPIVALWLVVAFILWRLYPSLLLRASAHRVALSDANAAEELFDPVTMRALSANLVDAEVSKCEAAVALVADAPVALAVEIFAEAIRTAPAHTRALLIQALDRLLQKSGTGGPKNPKAAAVLASLLNSPEPIGDRERVLLVQALGRVADADSGMDSRIGPLLQALRDKVPGVRVAATAALFRLGIDVAALPDLDETLTEAIDSADALTRQTALRELRSSLTAGSPGDPHWQTRLQLLTRVSDSAGQRAEYAEVLADVARAHGSNLRSISPVVLGWRNNSDPRVRSAVMRFIGYTGLEEHAPWLVDHIGSDHESEAAAAREALLLLGPQATNALMVEHCFGRRSTRDAILAIVRELKIRQETLKRLYQREVESIQQILLDRWVLSNARHPRKQSSEHGLSPILLTRLEERIDEGLHTALLFVTAIHDEDRVAELDDLLRHTRDKRQRAILLEALETLLSPQEKGQLMPLLEDRDFEVLGRRAADNLGRPVPSYEQAARALMDDPDELTRSLALATLPKDLGGQAPSSSQEIDDPSRRLSTTDIALMIHNTPIFAHLSTRQLMDLAKVIHEESHPAGAIVLREGDEGQSMYVIVDGNVAILKGDTVLGNLGAGDFFGEMAIFERDTRLARSATVLAQTNLRLLRLEGDDLLRLIEELPAIAVSICQYLSHRLQDLNSRLQSAETHEQTGRT